MFDGGEIARDVESQGFTVYPRWPIFEEWRCLSTGSNFCVARELGQTVRSQLEAHLANWRAASERIRKQNLRIA